MNPLLPCPSTYLRGRARIQLSRLLVLLATVLPLPASALTFCVGTPAELTSALQSAVTTPTSDEIRVRQGTYNLAPGLNAFEGITGDLAISGGWNSACTGVANDPYLTTIQGNAWVLRSAQSDISLSRLRFSGLPFVELNQVLGDDCDPVGQRFRVERSVFDGASSNNSRLIFGANCHQVEVNNVLAIGGVTGIEVRTSDDAATPPSVRIVHATILGADSEGIFVNHLDADAVGFVELYNSVISGSGFRDVFAIRAVLLARNNHYVTSAITAGGFLHPSSAGNSTANPQVQANGQPIQPSSPVINTGALSIAGGLPPADLVGNPRVVGSAPDRGAFETPITDLTALSVTTQSDSGPGSLRQAILTANASAGPQTIVFNIPVSCPATIFLQSPLPTITDSGLLFINGFTQPGSSPNTLLHGNNASICVRVRRNPNNDVSHALRIPAGSGTLLWLNQVAFGGFQVAAVELFGGDGHLIHGNRFGGNGLLGDVPPNGIGLRLTDGASNVQVGGNGSPGYRNTIHGNNLLGLLVDGSSGTQIINNYIGTSLNGTAATGNGTGVLIGFGATGTRILDNVISGNVNEGVLISSATTTDTVLFGNRIGVKRSLAAGSEALGNGGTGVRVGAGAHDNRIGGPGRGAGNRIGYNGDGGIWIQSGRRNRISSNAILDNVGLGIDLAEQGVNANNDDSGPMPTDYANRGLNFPVLAAASGGSQSGLVTGSLTTTPGSYRIEFFAVGGTGIGRPCDFGGHGEGERLVGHVLLTIPVVSPGPPQGTGQFVASIASASGLFESVITATAIDADGNTSEFSACRGYQSDVIFAHDFELP